MSNRTGYCITTWRLRLRCRHPQWLFLTQELFNQAELFYYDLFLEHEELWEENSQEILRKLEVLTLPGREKRIPENPLPWKIPPYFRRAAANAGIASAKSRLRKGKFSHTNRAEQLNSAMVFYKRMYKNFSQKEITLKLWDGSRWQWMRCRLYGRDFPEGGELMSPSVVFDRNFIMLHVPVKETTGDASSVRLRIREGRNICGLQFAGGDIACVGSVFDKDGKEVGVRFFRGGNAYSHRCRMVLERVEKSCKSMGGGGEEGQNRKYWIRLGHLTDSYAHEVSSEIVRFCQERDVSVIAIAKEKREGKDRIARKNGSGDGYANEGVGKSGVLERLHAEWRIREFLRYKAWKAGIVVIELSLEHMDDVCALCGSELAKTRETSGEFVCGMGHHGNRYLNAARNLAKNCKIQFGK